jgi:hypothetical protein
MTMHDTGNPVDVPDGIGLGGRSDVKPPAVFLLGDTKVEVRLIPVPGMVVVVLTPRGPALTLKPFVPVLIPTPLRLRLMRVPFETFMLLRILYGMVISYCPWHAQPGGWWQVLFAAMHELPQALPVVHTLQHACAGGFVGSTTTGGMVGVSVGGKNTVGIAVGLKVLVGFGVRVGPRVLVGFGVRVGPKVLVGASVKNCVAVGFFVAVAVLVAVGVRVLVAVGSRVNVAGMGVNVGSFVAVAAGSSVAVGNSIVMLIFFGASGVHVGASTVAGPAQP